MMKTTFENGKTLGAMKAEKMGIRVAEWLERRNVGRRVSVSAWSDFWALEGLGFFMTLVGMVVALAAVAGGMVRQLQTGAVLCVVVVTICTGLSWIVGQYSRAVHNLPKYGIVKCKCADVTACGNCGNRLEPGTTHQYIGENGCRVKNVE